jgi:hypothetical protein
MTKNKKSKQAKCPHCKKLIGKLLLDTVDALDHGAVYDSYAVLICPHCQVILNFDEPETVRTILFAITSIAKKMEAIRYEENIGMWKDISE